MQSIFNAVYLSFRMRCILLQFLAADRIRRLYSRACQLPQGLIQHCLRSIASTLEPRSVATASYPMFPHNPLQQLRDLDKASPQFHEQLRNFFHAYRDVWPILQSDGLARLVEYLDSVRLNLKVAPLCATLNMINIGVDSPRYFRPSGPCIPGILR